jgi:ribA/ribD-fused uncharacterized protein
MTVESFRSQYFPFSNMYSLESRIQADCGIWVPTSEHAYMSGRFQDRGIQEAVASAARLDTSTSAWRDGLAAKELAYQYIEAGAALSVTDDFERIALMRRVVSQKISKNALIRALLLSTGDEQIYEGNDWGDRFWGVSPIGSEEGENHLGIILMEIRDEELRE